MGRERRTRMDVYADVLESVRDASRKTHIVYEANLNFKRCKKYLNKLKENGLVEVQSQSPLAWVITEKGKDFLEEYNKIRDMLPR
ncbi:hypothetical protein AKJ38_02385 [candidate division MSBL1 archaeon SCGC-AAA259I14]|uniref:ArnR1-like winged helix-turn-helix domain-containing protein n=1 Tax=candidate division MSBL1 archaeon SCGC-AAA259I14 TaxID=1698268 RepID=A0A133URL0_9EURY|nr:hypothetical protein AKJ38_02385 [candidate division MSBL1 archaeon SCGC-AAA259I14]